MAANDDPVPGRDRQVIVDQVGYLPGDQKKAIVTAEATAFEVRTADDDEPVFEGALSDPVYDEAADERVRHAEFTPVSDPGEYVVVADDGSRSHPFRIGEGVYDDVLATVGRLYSLKRSDTPIDDPVTGLETEGGHGQDANAALFFADDYHDEGDILDVAGGWYDAGDYGKYVPPGAVAVAHMLLAHELAPEAFEPGQYDLPPGLEPDDPDVPDVLGEARFELEWLERMQRPDGAVYHKVGGDRWPGLDVRPSEDTQDRYVYGLSTFGTAMYAAAMAMAARVYRDVDPAFAERALGNARDAQSYLEANPEPYFRYDEGQDDGSGPYRKDGDGEERFWAAAELFRTTGEDRYAEYLEAELGEWFDADPTPPTWSDGLALGQWAYLRADAADPDRRSALESGFVAYADRLVETLDGRGYRIALDPDEYQWACSKYALAKGLVALLANELDPDDAYVAAAMDQLHYALGRTPTGYSYVTGVGEKPVRNPHDRMVASTGTMIPGMLVTGANGEGGDRIVESLLDEHSPPPAKAFVDDERSPSLTEWAVDYTAPLFVVLAYACDGVEPTG
ncbi:MAG: glycoside hydrolase family 9 protein [Haloarculaceae archaeon]